MNSKTMAGRRTLACCNACHCCQCIGPLPTCYACPALVHITILPSELSDGALACKHAYIALSSCPVLSCPLCALQAASRKVHMQCMQASTCTWLRFTYLPCTHFLTHALLLPCQYADGALALYAGLCLFHVGYASLLAFHILVNYMALSRGNMHVLRRPIPVHLGCPLPTCPAHALPIHGIPALSCPLWPGPCPWASSLGWWGSCPRARCYQQGNRASSEGC